jgi:hypothetical protein
MHGWDARKEIEEMTFLPPELVLPLPIQPVSPIETLPAVKKGQTDRNNE